METQLKDFPTYDKTNLYPQVVRRLPKKSFGQSTKNVTKILTNKPFNQIRSYNAMSLS